MREFLRSSNWWIDGEDAYFFSETVRTLFRVDLKTCQCDFLARIPTCDLAKHGVNSYCRKYRDKLFCFPYDQKKICCYDLRKSAWEEIEVGYEGPLMICMDSYKKEDDKIWLLEHARKKIFEVNLERQKVEQEYIGVQDEAMFNCQYVLVHNKLYYISGSTVCCIDTEYHTIAKYDIEGVDFQLYTICYDGQNFWISGAYDEIYIWNPVQGVVKVIKDILNEYKVLDVERTMIILGVPLFNYSVLLGQYVWFIPIQVNAPITYIHKDSHIVHILEIAEEKETEDTLKKRKNAFKYRVEYVRSERYIGIYSLKNQNIFEIDTEELQVKERKYELSDSTKYMIAKAYYKEKELLHESGKFDYDIFSILLQNCSMKEEANFSCIGKYIYTALI